MAKLSQREQELRAMREAKFARVKQTVTVTKSQPVTENVTEIRRGRPRKADALSAADRQRKRRARLRHAHA